MTRSRLLAISLLSCAAFVMAGGLRGQTKVANDPLLSLKGHEDTIDGVAISPDGSFFATACFDRNVRLFDATTGQQVRVYGGEQGHKSQVLCIDFASKGDYIATGGADNTVRIWEIPVSSPVATITTAAPATRVEVSADKTLAFATTDGLVKILPKGEDKGILELKGHAGAVTQLGLSGQTWVTAGADQTIRFWTADGKPLAARFVAGGTIAGLATVSNGSTAWIGTTDGRVQAWAVPPPTATPLFVAAPGSGLAVAAFEIMGKKGAPIPAIPVREWNAEGAIRGVVLSPDQQRIVTVGPGAECVAWNSGNGQKDKTFATAGAASAAAFNKNGQQIAVAGADGSIRLYTFGDGKMIGTFKSEGPVSELAFHPTLPLLVGSAKNVAIAWNVAFQPGQPLPDEFGRVIQKFSHPAALASPVFGSDGQFFTAGADKQIRRFRIAADTPVKTLQHPNLVDAVAFDSTGEKLATGCHDGVLRIWDVAKNTPLKTITAHVQTQPQNIQHPIYSVVWSPDQKQVFTASYDRTIKLWDVASGNLVREFKAAPELKPEDPKNPPKPSSDLSGHRDQIFSIALSKDGKLMASGSSDKTVKLWNVASGKVVRDFANPDLKATFPDEPAPSHPGWVYSVRFSPEGDYLISAGAAPKGKSYLAVWHVADGKRVYSAERDCGPIHAVAITPDGTKLILGSAPLRGKPQSDAAVIKFPVK